MGYYFKHEAIEGAAMNLRLFTSNLRLFLSSPKDFLYSFTYSSKKVVRIRPFNPAAKKLGNRLVKELSSACPEANVYFFGSTNLEIDGLNDIDLIITSKKKEFKTTAAHIQTLLGKPTKVRPQRQEWMLKKDGFDVELVLCLDGSTTYHKHADVFEALQKDPQLLEEYIQIKKTQHHLSERQYNRSRMLFFNKLCTPKAYRFPWLSFSTILVSLFVIGVFALTVRGIAGNPTEANLNNLMWKDEGPLELSPDRGRFALMYSLLEDKSFYFSIPVAKFAAPDVAYHEGHFVSLFAPTVSYIIIPGYVIGKYFGVSQVGSFAVIAFFAFLNFLLIRAIAKKAGAHPAAATIGGLLFIFASPAFAYAVTLYQHHISTFLILLSIHILISKKSAWWYAIIWFLCALSISVDNPNLFLMAPIGIFALIRTFPISEKVKEYAVSVRWPGLVTMVVMALPLTFFLYFNKMSYGDAFQLAGTAASGTAVSQLEVPEDLPLTLKLQQPPVGEIKVDDHKKSAIAFFRPRLLPHGLYEHFLSWDRGMIIFTPVLLLGFIGAYLLGRDKPELAALIVSIIGVDALLYSMWGDPYGGWAFGSRYMIPAYSLLAILLAYALSKWRKNILFLLVVFALGTYSVGVNTIGALTSNRNPPKVEILALESLSGHEEKYTFTRNMIMLNDNRSKSFAFSQSIIRQNLTAWQFAEILIGSIGAVMFLYMIALYATKRTQEQSV